MKRQEVLYRHGLRWKKAKAINFSYKDKSFKFDILGFYLTKEGKLLLLQEDESVVKPEEYDWFVPIYKGE